MNKRVITDLQRERKLLTTIAEIVQGYEANGKSFFDFEKDYGCTLIFDECNLKGAQGYDGIWFHQLSYKTAFILKYDL